MGEIAARDGDDHADFPPRRPFGERLGPGATDPPEDDRVRTLGPAPMCVGACGQAAAATSRS